MENKNTEEPIIFYRKPGKYGHQTHAFAVPNPMAHMIEKDCLYKVTLEKTAREDK